MRAVAVVAPISDKTSLALLPSTEVPSILKKSLSATPDVNCATFVFDIPTASVAAVPNPNVDLCADASASSSNALPAEVKSYVPALIPDPVNCIPLSAADVNPANACSSASSLAFGTVPLAKLEAFNAVRLLPFAGRVNYITTSI